MTYSQCEFLQDIWMNFGNMYWQDIRPKNTNQLTKNTMHIYQYRVTANTNFWNKAGERAENDITINENQFFQHSPPDVLPVYRVLRPFLTGHPSQLGLQQSSAPNSSPLRHKYWLLLPETNKQCCSINSLLHSVTVDLGQHWLRYCLVAWQHQAITWTNIDVSLVKFCGIYVSNSMSVHVYWIGNLCFFHGPMS